jgi:DNA-binding transcriptional LysR family regulator
MQIAGPKVRKVGDVPNVVAANPALACRIGELQAWEHAPWIGWGERFANTPAAKWLARYRNVDPVLRSDSLTMQIAAVREGVGVALVPRASMKAYGLVPLHLSDELFKELQTLPTNELYLVTHRALREVPRVRVVWDGITNYLERIGLK